MTEYLKSSALKRMAEAHVASDVERALLKGDMERFLTLLATGDHTYQEALAEREVERGDDVYRHALEYSLMWLLEKRPFYSHMFCEVVRVETFKIPTLCVRIKDARIILSYNPDFLALNKPQANAVGLQHEMGHVIQGHTTLRRRLPKNVLESQAYTIALELAVNSLIQDIVDKLGFTVIPNDLLPVDGEDVEERQSWEYYYKLLLKVMPPPPQGGGGGGGTGKDGQGQGEGEKKLAQGQMDDHDGWADSDSADVQREVVKQTIAVAYQRAQRKGGSMRGYMPGELVDMIEELLKDKSVPFERLFRAFVGSRLKVGRKPTLMRLSRRRHVPPGNTLTRTLRLIWYQDDSGSMGMEECALCRSELHNALRFGNVHILFQRFCYGLVGDLVDLERADFKSCLKRATGGTDFDAVIDHAHEQKPDLIIIATDGEAPTPTRKPPCPMAWVLTNDGTAHPWGTIIRMPTIEEIKNGYKAVIERWAP